MNFIPKNIYYEQGATSYPLFEYLYKKYSDIPWTEIQNHNNIEMFRNSSNEKFADLKRNLIIGVRKSLRLVPNNKTSDFLVPYTSSGCTAACLYCYLVCNFNKCSYLRLFVNREAMFDKIIKASINSQKNLVFEIGSNSDMILENTLTGNLDWTIQKFAEEGKGKLTLPTKFDMVDPLLSLNHKGKTTIRMSLNPNKIINQVELKTSPLRNRLEALNKLKSYNYPIGVLVAPIILIHDWKKLYRDLFIEMNQILSAEVKRDLSIEFIFMTYSFVHRAINGDAFPNAINLYNKDLMTGRGPGRYIYKKQVKDDAKQFFIDLVNEFLPQAHIAYIV